VISALRGALLAPVRPDELVPPPRFAATTFASYRLDPEFPAQDRAVAAVRAFATAQASPWARLLRRRAPAGLYLDGGFGVGKTHLLAACFHAAHGSRRYLGFAEAISLLVLHGMARAGEIVGAGLVCIDEFELDDPANTRLADLLLDDLVRRRCRIVTTSNTIPGELGQGRFAADQFHAQLARIAEVFTDVHIPGRDWRRAQVGSGDPPGWRHDAAVFADAPDAIAIAADDLDRLLADVPVINLRRLAERVRRLTITAIAPFTDQFAALRFVTLVDRLYEACVRLRVRAAFPIDGLFPDQHCLAAFAKKYRRCQSRLVQLCAESGDG